jgi:hypothetical protein
MDNHGVERLASGVESSVRTERTLKGYIGDVLAQMVEEQGMGRAKHYVHGAWL